MSKILIVGYKGMLGSDLVKVLKKKNKIIGVSRPYLDVTNYKLCQKVCQKIKPQIVINTAAYHRVQECEENPEIAFSVNAIGAYNISKASKEINAKSIYISTDYVFDGSKKKFTENDLPNPLNIYGASKLAGEYLTKIANKKSYIIRTSWLFGIHQEQSSKGPNFVTQILEKAKYSNKIEVVSDQVGNPTSTLDLSAKISELLEKKVPYGIYHITNSGSCSWHEYALKIINLTKHKAIIMEASSSDPFVIRPKRSVMISKNLMKVKIKRLRNWKNALKDYVEINKLKNA